MNDGVVTEFNEANSNKFSIKCVIATILILYFMWMMNLLNIFIIDFNIFLTTVIGGTIIALVVVALSFILDLNKSYVKYILLLLITALYSFLTACLTYHVTICLIFPIIYSAQYRSKKVVWYTFGITTISVILCVIFGYFYGLCDANVLFYTTSTTKKFIDNFNSATINTTPNWLTNILFFAIPKIFVILGAVPMLIHLNTVIDKRTKDLIDTQESNLSLSQEIVANQANVIVSLASIVESRDQITGDHIKNTAKYVRFLTNKLIENNIYADELTNEYAMLVIEAAPLHDIGKIHIPDSILCKNGKLTAEEYDEMKKHPVYGHDLLSNFGENTSNHDYLKMARDVCLYHHERYDGKGYPNGLKEKEIPLCGRIMAIADVLDALLSKRQYKEAFSFEKTYNILNEESGKQFDQVLLQVLLDNWEEFKEKIYNS